MSLMGLQKVHLTPSIKSGQQRTQVGAGTDRCGLSRQNFARALEIRGQSRGEANSWNSGLEGILKSYIICAPKSSEAGSFYFENRPPSPRERHVEPLFSRAVAVLTTPTRWKFDPPNSSPATANTRSWSLLSKDLCLYLLPKWVRGEPTDGVGSECRERVTVKELSAGRDTDPKKDAELVKPGRDLA